MKISVIVPIYNAEPYLRDCLDSIRNQTSQDVEIILVDDGFSNGCAAICNEYAAADDRFQVIHKSNGDVDSLIRARQEIMAAVHWSLNYTQELRGYKRFLMGRRFKAQVLHGSWAEKKDFLRWLWSKFIRRDNGAKWLRTFDPLEPVQVQLRRANGLDGLFAQTAKQVLMAEDRNITLKTSRQVFIFAGVHYCDIGGGQRSAQLARTFNDMGYRVYYIYYGAHPLYGEGKPDPFQDGTMFNPTLLHCHVDAFSVHNLDRLVRRGAFFIFEVPVDKFEPYLDYAKAHRIPTVYEHIDNWDSELGKWFYREDIFRRYLEECTLVTVTARLLGEKVREISPQTEYLYLPNAVNAALFEPMKSYVKPDDLVEGTKTLLYFGSLWGEWFDWDKLVYVAEHCDCAINLIGGCEGLEERMKTLPKNIHFLGQKPQVELPAYLAHSDIALLPFVNGEIGKYVSPLKIFEYIAMNKPVLATPLDDITGYPNVFASDDEKEWARAVTEEWPTIIDTEVFTAQNSWYARCNMVLNHTGQKAMTYPNITVIILNRNNMKVIFRCVSSLLAFNERYGCEIIVVDNDSTDGSYEKLKQQYGNKITLLKNQKNGCSSGRNLGVQAAHGEYLFFLDSDQWAISESYLDIAIEILYRERDIGAVGWAAGWFSPGKCAGPIADSYPNRAIKSPRILFRTDIAYLGSGGLLLKKSLFEEIGGFDERYDPTCFEDTDLSLKIRHAGYELAYCPYIGLMHLPHQTTLSGSDAHAKLMRENGAYFMKKWQEIEPGLLEYYI